MKSAGFDVVDVVNGELAERPDKRRTRDISETPLSDGLRRLSGSPGKALKIGHYGRNLVRRVVGDWRYGRHYRTAIMTVLGIKKP